MFFRIHGVVGVVVGLIGLSSLLFLNHPTICSLTIGSEEGSLWVTFCYVVGSHSHCYTCHGILLVFGGAIQYKP